ncbi:MarR family winged helix-turn-helix transcriptional regulator [Streptomyces sp. NPDC088354]|uniref:MarR family winged helix-turn-helix transcriptional regulator n=1 Tax=unclassified Streptomyces TaxID=2593676 RepID=UPI0029AD7F70|nr:MarR family transcriptional regulator [Streptomyces sp. MI02-7b]MDX3071063.1 MarR family transcriptional regulator [Streptomyces sp. MI02-7b]
MKEVQMPARDTAIDTIQRELTAFARRARTRATQIHPELSLVAYGMLDYMKERGGCRGTDLASHFLLDKSTVSRQIAMLERAGLIARGSDPQDQRGQILRPSEQGLRLLAEANERRRIAFAGRFADWDDTDVQQLADHLQRYNAAG